MSCWSSFVVVRCVLRLLFVVVSCVLRVVSCCLWFVVLMLFYVCCLMFVCCLLFSVGGYRSLLPVMCGLLVFVDSLCVARRCLVFFVVCCCVVFWFDLGCWY